MLEKGGQASVPSMSDMEKVAKSPGDPSRRRRGRPSDDTPTVLVVDDEPHLLRLLSSTFEKSGYRVLAARDGPGAVAEFERKHATIDAVFLDVGIPPAGIGCALERMLAIRRDVGLVLMSGDDLHEGLRATLDAHGGHFVRKPFARANALRALRLAMGER